jgi:Domain of unknown function (DUF4387)
VVTTLDDVASVLRSKNAGPFFFTIDVFLPDKELFDRVAHPDFLTPERVAQAYRVPTSEVQGIYRLESALAIKVTIRKQVLADDPGNTDVIASQQHLPLAWIPLPD